MLSFVRQSIMETLFTKLFLIVQCMATYTTASSFTSHVHNYSAGINWFDAFKSCEKNEFDLEHDNFTTSDLNQLQDHEFWIGIIKYNETTPWIEIVGCYNNTNRPEIIPIAASIGSCQHHCQSSPYFSYQRSTNGCTCLNVDLTYRRKAPFSYCREFSNRSDFTLVYQRSNFNGNEPVENCVVSICNLVNNNKRQVTLSQMNCSLTDSSILVVCDDLKSPSENDVWGKTYFMAKEKCFEANKNLISTKSCSNHTGTKLWTNTFRELIQVEYFRKKPNSIKPAGCLSGKRNKSGSNGIVITERSCNDILYAFVCKSENSVESTNHLASNKGNTYSQLPSISSTMDTIVESTSHLISNIDNTYSKLSNTTSTIGTLVGGIFGGVIAIAIITLILIWIRRRTGQQANPKGSELNANEQELSSIKHVSNMQYGLAQQNIASVHVYAVVHKGNKLQNKRKPEYTESKKGNNLSTPEDSYVLATDEEYDRLNNVLSRKRNPEGNVYGIVGECGDDEYNTLNNIASKVNHAESLYNSNKPSCKGNEDQTYDTSINPQHKHNGSDTIYDFTV